MLNKGVGSQKGHCLEERCSDACLSCLIFKQDNVGLKWCIIHAHPWRSGVLARENTPLDFQNGPDF